ncbi:uncharacterized protein C8R40DRAFT_339313 [Lentinula edodes]|uniref:uncharacterized protein n=1 Tax=Lentinula edodes TaxID=5353 RepID=UPI001E8D0098|nr:uncharacterized protein C8R40DRAFT_339313 [Lentinula edodes]KAH7873962.1 hypothetical protein C8R40DRAFT_339313 [Lentinula edodes]
MDKHSLAELGSEDSESQNYTLYSRDTDTCLTCGERTLAWHQLCNNCITRKEKKFLSQSQQYGMSEHHSRNTDTCLMCGERTLAWHQLCNNCILKKEKKFLSQSQQYGTSEHHSIKVKIWCGKCKAGFETSAWHNLCDSCVPYRKKVLPQDVNDNSSRTGSLYAHHSLKSDTHGWEPSRQESMHAPPSYQLSPLTLKDLGTTPPAYYTLEGFNHPEIDMPDPTRLPLDPPFMGNPICRNSIQPTVLSWGSFAQDEHP